MIERIKNFVFRPAGNRRVRSARASTPASARLETLRRWIVWLIVVAVVVAAVVAFASFSAADPAWSTTGRALRVKNWLGSIGAWLSDMGYFVLGATVWWVLAFAALAAWRALPPTPSMTQSALARSAVALDDESTDLAATLALSWRIAGLSLLLLASSALEALGMHRIFAGLPQGAGGALGQTLAFPLLNQIGFVPSTLLLIVLLFIGLSLAFAIPWLRVSEWIGALVLDGFSSWREQREEVREIKRDHDIAAPEVELREMYVREETRRVEAHEPIRIVETFEPIVLSERVEREKQTTLFSDIPDSVLPQLSLLEPLPREQPVVSAETLEFTSRLIERKLAEFNVPVKVLAAYPGPVITRYEIEPDVGVKGNSIVNLAKDLARAMSVIDRKSVV